MQVTLELPERLARRLPKEPDELAEILERGLWNSWAVTGSVGSEVLDFLASGPSSEEILEYRPSEALVERTHVLLDKNRENSLTDLEEDELDELAQLDTWFSLLKAKAAKHAQSKS